MQARQCLANGRAMVRTWPPNPQSVKKCDDRGRPAGDLAKEGAALVLYRLRTGDAASRQMLHQAQKKWQIVFGDPLFIQRQNEIAGACVHQKIRVLDALRDALGAEKLADVVSGHTAGVIFRRNVGIDGHTGSLRRLVGSQWTRQRKKHPLLHCDPTRRRSEPVWPSIPTFRRKISPAFWPLMTSANCSPTRASRRASRTRIFWCTPAPAISF